MEWNPREAARLRAQGEALLQPTTPIQVSAGEAVPQEPQVDGLSTFETFGLVETLECPTTIAAGVRKAPRRSGARRRPAAAIDAAQTARSANSIEKMLCHQMAAAHFAAMRLLEQSANPKLQQGEVARFTNAAARLMDVYQNASRTLQKLKSRGTQRVLVQYQQVYGRAWRTSRCGWTYRAGLALQEGEP